MHLVERNEGDILNHPLTKVLPGDLAVAAQQHALHAHQTGESQYFERRGPLPDGSEALLGVTLIPLGNTPMMSDAILGVAEDIAERDIISRNLESILAEHEAQRQALFQAGIVCLFDLEGRLIYVSDSYSHLAGQVPEVLRGSLITQQLQDPQYFSEGSELWQEIHGGEIWRGELCRLNAAGQAYWLQSTIVPLRDAHDRVYQFFQLDVDITRTKQAALSLEQNNLQLESAVLARTQELEIATRMLENDIEKRREAEAELRRQQVLLESVLASLGEHIAVIDREGVVILRNQAWDQFTEGQDLPDPLHAPAPGENYLNACALFDRYAPSQQTAEAIRLALAGREVRSEIEYSCLYHDQQRNLIMRVSPWIGGQGGVQGGAILTHIDLTELKQMQAAHTRLVSIAENTSDVVMIAASAGLLIYLNRAGRTLFGLQATADLSHVHVNDLLTPESAAQLQAVAIPTAMSQGMWRGELKVTRPGGEPVPMSAVLLAQFDGSGQFDHFSCIARDISETIRSQNELRKHNDELQLLNSQLKQVQDQLLQSEKMASIGQLAAGVAHEINNPIGYVNSNLGSLEGYINDLLALLETYEQVEAGLPEAVQQSVIQPAKQRADLQFLRDDLTALLAESKEGITRVKKIVQDLKDFSRVDSSSEWEFANLHRCLDSTLNIVHNEVKYKANVVKEYGELPEVQCLPSQLNQVFMNMLVNASHAIKEHGTIWIRSGCDGELAWVEFQDTGGGIAPDNLKRIFDPFFTTKPVGKGTGLGLSLSYSIVQKHHGHIDVNSVQGQGTTFRIWLPIHQEADMPEMQAEAR